MNICIDISIYIFLYVFSYSNYTGIIKQEQILIKPNILVYLFYNAIHSLIRKFKVLLMF